MKSVIDMKIQAATFGKLWLHRGGDGKLVLVDEDVLPSTKANQELYRKMAVVQEIRQPSTKH